MEDVLLTEILCGAALSNQSVRLYIGSEPIQITPAIVIAPTEVVDTGETFVPTIEAAAQRGVLVRGSHETAFMVTSAGASTHRRLVFQAEHIRMIDLADINFTPQSLSDAD